MTTTTTMLRVCLVVLLVLSVTTTTAAVNLKANSKFGKHLLAQSHRVLEQNGQQMDADFVADYSIKFQGCHHVSQWNGDVDDEDDVRIRTKRLVRFRLCPSDSCQNSRSAGCTSKYGDYVVDLNTFVYSYMEALADEGEQLCADAKYECQSNCNQGEDEDCMTACYEDMDVEFCFADNQAAQNDGFDVNDYVACAEFELGGDGRRRLNDDAAYYLGPYCADQGGEIHMGLFTDDTCTTFAGSGESTFYDAMGYELPFSDISMISTRCLMCGASDGDGNYELKEVCDDIYQVSGKCETKMSVEYPNESACTYIEGIKIIREDGVIRTSAVKKSKAAAVCIGLFLTVAVLLAGYVYYLRTKLGRAKINLAAASQATLT
eukprot:CAMPEP_0194039138 /NCGR_PEP_ID=MMETSP0009_2-20130614/11302_1 /TAXON_ID=210454 /ORGANISM="Grammatophora oceanica, Strain CCMP 410" /LENGTH=375 /DNA_ID=CAMNT_0038681877 /DNA_START=149 /DNA_END=1276 /DNA_ORIENTATION=+